MAALILGGLLFAAGVQAVKFGQRYFEDGKIRPSEIRVGYQSLIFQVLSCLVAGVYAADKGEQNASDHWRLLGYEKVELEGQTKHSDTSTTDVCGNPKCAIRLMLFRYVGYWHNSPKLWQPTADDTRDDNAADGRFKYTETSWPKYVVAIRGTITNCPNDFKADIHILAETLHADERLYVSVEKVIQKIVQEHGCHNVWVAGHSLGSTIGLIATRKLALEGKVLKTHLFNPPFASLDVIFLKKLGKSIRKGLKDGFNLTDETEAVALEVVRPVAKLLSKGVRKVGAKVDPEYCKAMASDSEKLRTSDWVPRLYVNPKDTISNGYKEHFKKNVEPAGARLTGANSAPPSTSVAAPFVRLAPKFRIRSNSDSQLPYNVHLTRRDSRSYHMIPEAILYMNHWGQWPFEAHKLYQWFSYHPVDLKVYNCTPREISPDDLVPPAD